MTRRFEISIEFCLQNPEEDYKFVRECAVHYHIKDVASDDAGWYFTEIGQGTIDYQKIIKDLAEIRRVITGSDDFVKRVLFGLAGFARGPVDRFLRQIEFIPNGQTG